MRYDKLEKNQLSTVSTVNARRQRFLNFTRSNKNLGIRRQNAATYGAIATTDGSRADEQRPEVALTVFRDRKSNRIRSADGWSAGHGARRSRMYSRWPWTSGRGRSPVVTGERVEEKSKRNRVVAPADDARKRGRTETRETCRGGDRETRKR